MKMIAAIIKPFRLEGTVGDGKIFVWDLEKAIRIRTGETDTAAL